MNKFWRILLACGLVLFMVGCDDDDDNNNNNSGPKTGTDVDTTVYDFTVPTYQEGASCNPDTFNQFCDGKKKVSCGAENKVEIEECFETNITASDCVWYQQKDMPHSFAECTVANSDACSSVGKSAISCGMSTSSQMSGGVMVSKTVYKESTSVCAKTQTGKEAITYKTEVCDENDTTCIERCKKYLK